MSRVTLFVISWSKNLSVSSSVHLLFFHLFFLLCWSFYGGSSSGWQPSQSMNYASWRRMTRSVPTHMDERHRLHLRNRLLPPFTKHIWPRSHNFEATFRSNQLAGDSFVSLCVLTDFFRSISNKTSRACQLETTATVWWMFGLAVVIVGSWLTRVLELSGESVENR